MKQTLFTALVIASALSATSCSKVRGEGPVITEQRTAGRFSKISSGISGDIYYTPDSVYHIEVQAQKNILDILNTDVAGDELVIEFDRNKIIGRHDRIEVYISGPGVTALSVNGSGDLKVRSSYSPEQLDLRISGSGSIRIPELYTGNISSRISGSGDINVLNGTAYHISTDINGSGSIDLIGVAAVKVSTRTSGSGNTSVQASETLDVRISGSGDVYYRGRPRISTNISGSGRVIAK